jgi:type I restriction enzyme R subunit
MFVSIDKATALRMHDKVLTSTDMAPIVSPGQNEVEQMKAMGLDIVPR